MTAIGYIRQSRRADLDVALSYDVQLAAIRRMAASDGIEPDDVTMLADMGRSGAAGKERLRAAYQELLTAVDGGDVTHVYALSMSRVARSLTELSKFYARCAERGIHVRFDKEGEIRFDTPDGKLRANIIGSVYEFERDLAVERARDNAKVRRARGERMGRLPYGEKSGESAGAVLAAFHDAGSYNGAALLLNARGVPTRLGRPWGGTAVRLVVARHGQAPRHAERGVQARSSFRFARLLACPHDRHFLTASRDGRGDRDVVYRCHAADTNPAHPRPYRVQEARVLPWAMAEAARLRLPDAVEVAGHEAERADLAARRDRVVDTYVSGSIDRADRDRRLAQLDAQLDALTDAASIVKVPELDWTWPPEAVNDVLRALWSRVRLDERMAPVEAVWRVPGWRS